MQFSCRQPVHSPQTANRIRITALSYSTGARFHGPRAEERELGRNDGILLPAGSYYRLETIGEEPLVILRLGATTGDGHRDTRIMDDGEAKIRRGRDETFMSEDVAYRDGAFYE